MASEDAVSLIVEDDTHWNGAREFQRHATVVSVISPTHSVTRNFALTEVVNGSFVCKSLV